MHERDAYYHEQQDPIEGETDREPRSASLPPTYIWISRPAEYAARRECECWLRRSSVCSDAPEDAGGTGHHSEAGNEGDGADHDPSKEWNMDEQAQWHKKVEDNPHNKNRNRDQRGEDE